MELDVVVGQLVDSEANRLPIRRRSATSCILRERNNLFQGSYNPFNDGAVGRPSAPDDHFEMSSHTRTIKLSGRPPVSETRLARSSKGVKESIIKRFNGGRGPPTTTYILEKTHGDHPSLQHLNLPNSASSIRTGRGVVPAPLPPPGGRPPSPPPPGPPRSDPGSWYMGQGPRGAPGPPYGEPPPPETRRHSGPPDVPPVVPLRPDGGRYSPLPPHPAAQARPPLPPQGGPPPFIPQGGQPQGGPPLPPHLGAQAHPPFPPQGGQSGPPGPSPWSSAPIPPPGLSRPPPNNQPPPRPPAAGHHLHGNQWPGDVPHVQRTGWNDDADNDDLYPARQVYPHLDNRQPPNPGPYAGNTRVGPAPPPPPSPPPPSPPHLPPGPGLAPRGPVANVRERVGSLAGSGPPVIPPPNRTHAGNSPYPLPPAVRASDQARRAPSPPRQRHREAQDRHTERRREPSPGRGHGREHRDRAGREHTREVPRVPALPVTTNPWRQASDRNHYDPAPERAPAVESKKLQKRRPDSEGQDRSRQEGGGADRRWWGFRQS